MGCALRSFVLFVLVTTVFSVPGLAGKRVILAISKTDHVLVLLDPVTFKTIARIPVGEDPHEVVVNGTTAYVSNTGFGTLHEINVIDLATQKL